MSSVEPSDSPVSDTYLSDGIVTSSGGGPSVGVEGIPVTLWLFVFGLFIEQYLLPGDVTKFDNSAVASVPGSLQPAEQGVFPASCVDPRAPAACCPHRQPEALEKGGAALGP